MWVPRLTLPASGVSRCSLSLSTDLTRHHPCPPSEATCLRDLPRRHRPLPPMTRLSIAAAPTAMTSPSPASVAPRPRVSASWTLIKTPINIDKDENGKMVFPWFTRAVWYLQSFRAFELFSLYAYLRRNNQAVRKRWELIKACINEGRFPVWFLL